MPVPCSIVTVARRPTAVIKAEAAFAKLPEVQRTARARLAKLLPSLDAGATGPDCTRWRLLEGGGLAMEIGRVVARAFAAAGEVVPSELPAGRAAHLSMEGGFENLPLAWQTLFDWCKAEKLSPAGINWEIYGATEGADLYVLLAVRERTSRLAREEPVSWPREGGDLMIKRFHALFVGQIDLDNVGLGGTPANDRRYSNQRLSEVFETTRDVARLMDELGYHALWTAEHHFQHEGYECLPNLVQLSLWLATQTKRLKFGCGFNVLPMWHPIRLAEDYAMADIVTDGRVIMGVGRGYHSREVETFGAPLLDAEANREYFEEQLELLLKCFNEQTFHHKGKYFECPPPVPYRGYQMKEITVVPRPKHLPVEIWMPIASGRTIDMMARYGLKAMVDLNGEKILDDSVRAYQAACAKYGRQKKLGEDMIWGAGLYIAGSQEEAIRRVEPAHDERYKWFAPFGFVRYADEHGRTWGTPGAPASIPSIRDGVKQKAWFCGTSAEVTEGIKSIEAKYPGLEDFMIHWAEGLSPAEFKDQLRRFAREVMPAFQGARMAAE